MSGYPLFELNPSFLAKVISKFNLKNYCRLKQTCREISEFIENNRKIKIYVRGCLSLRRDYDGSLELQISESGTFRYFLPASLESLNGIHFKEISPVFSRSRGTFEFIYNAMKPYDLSCTRVNINAQTSKEECEKILNLLKPVSVSLITLEGWGNPPLFTANELPEPNGLKNVIAMLTQEEAECAVEQLLSAKNIEKLNLDVRVTSNFPCIEEVRLTWFIAVLQRVHIKKNMRYFNMTEQWLGPLPPVEDLIEKLSGLNPVVQEVTDKKCVIKCHLGRNSEFTIDNRCIQIHLYETGDQFPHYMALH